MSILEMDADSHRDMGLWKQAIGDFMVSFNECEYWVYQYIDQTVPRKLANVLAEERLQKRAKAALAAIQDAGIQPEGIVIEDLFGRLKKLADYRNILAHNAPMIVLYEYSSTSIENDSTYEMAIELTSARGMSTTLTEVQERATEAKNLSAEMLRLFEAIVRKKNPAPPA